MKKRLLAPILLAAALLLGMAAALVVSHLQAAALEEKMQGVWYREGGENWHLSLAVDEDTMTYRFISAEFPDITETIYTYGYDAKSGSTVRIDFPENGGNTTVTVTVTEKEMTFSPAVTVSRDAETWKKR